MSYWDIKYFTATKLKREHHSFAFLISCISLSSFHSTLEKEVHSALGDGNPRHGEREENQQICGV